MSTQSLTLPPPPPQPQASGENPLSTRDGEDDDAAPGDLRLNFSESIEALSLSTLQNTRSSTFKSTTSPGTNAKFNPHVTVGGTVHASSRLAVGRNGVSYGADTRFRLDPGDFAPLRVSADVLSSAPNSRENTTLTHEVSSSSSSSQPPAAAPTSESTSVSTGNLLGRGASGSVRLMVHLPTARPVAVKTIATVEKHHFDEILSEIRALCDAKTAFDSALNSPTPLDFDAKDESPLGVPPSPSAPGFIVDFLGAWSTDGFVNIAMECMAGSLADIDSPPVPILSRMSNMLLKGLSVMHRKLSLLHRDLKPANVLFDATGVVKVADFGVSSRLEASKLEQTSTFIGSIMYMSPERVKGESYSYSSDVWALAITIMEVFLGQHPFRAHAGDAAFHGNHEKKFWKMVEVFTTAAAFDRQLANVLEYAKKHGNGGEAIVPEQSPPLAQVAKVSDAQDYPSILEMANTAGFDLGDPRIPANAGYVARICTKDPRVPRELADFVTRCLSMSQFNRATVVELMSHPFIQMHCQSPEADRRAVSQWLLTYVPKVATSPALAQAARDVAAAKLCNATVAAASTISTGKADGESPKAAEKDAAARNPSPPAAVVKSAKVRAALSNLAAEPKPAPKAKAVVVAPAKASSTADGSIFADDPSGVGSSGCCLWTGMTPQQQKPAPTTKEASPTASPPQVPAAAPGKPNNTAATNPSDGNCMVS